MAAADARFVRWHSEAKSVEEVCLCMLDASNAALLEEIAPGVFDHPIDPRWRDEFVQDPRHHLALAIVGSQVIGMASGVHYVHPDKAPEMWINEVGVATTHRGAGLGHRLVEKLLIRARELGCHEAWVLTDQGNRTAMRMYAKAGGLEEPVPSTMFTFRLPVHRPDKASD